MRLQLPTIIALCVAVGLIVPLIYFVRVDEDGMGVGVNLESEEFKQMRTHAKDAFNAKKYEQAIVLYENSVKMRPENAEVYNDLGATYYAFGLEYAGPSWPSWESDLAGKTVFEAREELKTAVSQTVSGYIELKSDRRELTEAVEKQAKQLGATVHINMWEERATISILLGKTQEFLTKARDSYIRAVDLKPTYSPAYRNLGSLFMKLGQSDTAVDYLQEAYALDPRDKELEQYLSQFKRRF